MCRANPGAYPVIKFNIIYIMRTKVGIHGFWRPGLIHGVSPRPTKSAPVAHAFEQIRFSAGHKPLVFTYRLPQSPR